MGTPPRQTDDLLLFQDGMERLKAGKYGTASLAFHALLSVYPESTLADRAREAMQTADRLEQKRDYWKLRVAETQGGRGRGPD